MLVPDTCERLQEPEISSIFEIKAVQKPACAITVSVCKEKKNEKEEEEEKEKAVSNEEEGQYTFALK